MTVALLPFYITLLLLIFKFYCMKYLPLLLVVFLFIFPSLAAEAQQHTEVDPPVVNPGPIKQLSNADVDVPEIEQSVPTKSNAFHSQADPQVEN